MYCNQQVKERIYWTGVNDRRKELFENLWPLPNGVSYNSYLIKDEKTVLMDTIESGSNRNYLDWISSILGDRKLDYLVIHHMELDHSGEIENLIARYPDIKIVGNAKTFKVLEAYYGILPNLMEVKDGDELNIGYHNLKFVFTPWVHWPETMMSLDTTDGVLFSGDAFGMFGTLDGGIFDDQVDLGPYQQDEMLRYYSNIVGKYSNMVQKALAKLADANVNVVCPLHGLIWRADPARVIGLYDKWSKQEAEDGVLIVYASMYNNTAQMADYLACCLAEKGVKNIKVCDISKTHISYLIRDIWKTKGIILGSCAYNGEMFPLMENLTRELQHYGVKNKYLGVFGTFSWNGGGVRNLNVFAESCGWELVGESAEIHGRPEESKTEKCRSLAAAMAAKFV